MPVRLAPVLTCNLFVFLSFLEYLMNTAIVGGSGLSFTYLCGPFISACVKVEVACKLSGMPDLTLSFVNPRILDDVSFHP